LTFSGVAADEDIFEIVVQVLRSFRCGSIGRFVGLCRVLELLRQHLQELCGERLHVLEIVLRDATDQLLQYPDGSERQIRMPGVRAGLFRTAGAGYLYECVQLVHAELHPDALISGRFMAAPVEMAISSTMSLVSF
jgi:hypothetical protein